MKKKVLFVLSLLFGLMLINAGLNKFLNYMPMPEKMPEKLVKVSNAFVEIGWLMPLTGFVEILGGMLFIFPNTKALGAIVILPVMVGIVLTNTVTEPSGMLMALILFAINLWAIADNWKKYTPMFQQKPVYAENV